MPDKIEWKVCPNVRHENLDVVLGNLSAAGWDVLEFLSAGTSGAGGYVTVIAARPVGREATAGEPDA